MKYYVKQLSVTVNQLNKLKNTLYHETTQNQMLLSDCGYFTIYNNQYYHHFIDTNNLDNDLYNVVENYLDDYTLYVDNSKWIKRKVDAISPKHVTINTINEIYKLNEKCNVSLVVEKTKKGEIVDIYFSSYLNENDFSFQETLSYFLAKLI